jgi:tetratricopeptide (TPR) repeat protein
MLRRPVHFLVALLSLLCLSGCSGGLSSRTAAMRTALDEGEPQRAIELLDAELRVKSGAVVPRRLRGDDALLLLDRATIQQSVAELTRSKRDYEAADRALDALDLSHGASDDAARWLISDAAGRYRAPSHEKLLVNVLNMVNYLELRDLAGARVEARRLSVTARYLRDRRRETGEGSAALGLGSLLAGFTYEKSGDLDEARRYYDDATGMDRARREREVAQEAEARWTEVLLVVGWGRVPHRVANHVPIGQALTRASSFLAPSDREQADRLAAQGLVTWVSFPTLAPDTTIEGAPIVEVDGRAVALDATLDVASEVREEWRRIEGAVMAAATTRAVARVLLGTAIEGAASTSDKKEVRALGTLLSLLTQAALAAADTPDTRSWETLPARLGLSRVRVAPGAHRVRLEARGQRRLGTLEVTAGGWRAMSLLALL